MSATEKGSMRRQDFIFKCMEVTTYGSSGARAVNPGGTGSRVVKPATAGSTLSKVDVKPRR
jgi:hypothetical protein